MKTRSGRSSTSQEYGKYFRREVAMSVGAFNWLVNLLPPTQYSEGGDTCYLEPYIPSHFACQFGYNQLYIGNPNANLGHNDNLINETRAGDISTSAAPTLNSLCLSSTTSNLVAYV